MSLFYVKEPNGIWRKRTVSLDHYDPEFLQRAIALWADSRIGDRYFCNSGSRSYAHQAALYAIYKAGGNLAARPGTSRHEYGSKAHPVALAMDINPLTGNYAELHKVAYEYGFWAPLASERWHLEMRPNRKPLPNNPGHFEPLEEEDMPQCTWNDGAIAQVNAKGEVFCPVVPGKPVAKHWGNMTNLRNDAKQSFSGKATVIAPVDDNNSQAGYYILDEQYGLNNEFWKFDQSTKQFFK